MHGASSISSPGVVRVSARNTSVATALTTSTVTGWNRRSPSAPQATAAAVMARARFPMSYA